MDTAWKKRRRERLWEQQNGRCYYCSRPMLHWTTFEPGRGKKPPEVLCTIEHLFDRYDSRRHQNVGSFRNLVLACYACNHNRGVERQVKMAAAGVLSYGVKRGMQRYGTA